MAFLNDFKELFANAAQSVSNKTKDSVENARLAGESRGIAGDLAELYEQIGRAYVDSLGKNGETLSALCQRALELREKLEALERQRMQLRNQNRCPGCGALMAKEARFCSSCGRRMPEPAPEPEAAPSAESMRYCPECGAMKKEDDPFCAVCGFAGEAAAEPEELVVQVVRPKPPVHDDGDEAPDDFEAD